MQYLQAFLCGGVLCAIGQLLIDKTQLTPARILTGYVVAGVLLQAVGVYQYVVDWGGAGATVPLTGFGYCLAKGVAKAVAEKGILGAFTGGLTATAGGVAAAVFSACSWQLSSNRRINVDKYPLGVYNHWVIKNTPRRYMKMDCCCCHQKTKHRSPEEQRSLINRLSRIEGQVRGLRDMLQKDAYCTDILVQVSAVNAALNSFSKELLATHIRTCVADGIRRGDDEVIDELVTTLQKLMK